MYHTYIYIHTSRRCEIRNRRSHFARYLQYHSSLNTVTGTNANIFEIRSREEASRGRLREAETVYTYIHTYIQSFTSCTSFHSRSILPREGEATGPRDGRSEKFYGSRELTEDSLCPYTRAVPFVSYFQWPSYREAVIPALERAQRGGNEKCDRENERGGRGAKGVDRGVALFPSLFPQTFPSCAIAPEQVFLSRSDACSALYVKARRDGKRRANGGRNPIPEIPPA